MIEIDATSSDGNGFVIMGCVQRILRESGANQERINSVLSDMMSSDYEHLCDVAERETGGVLTIVNRER